MANVLFKRGNTATITGTAITDGQLLYDTTTGRHYVDVGSTRKEVGKVVDTTLSTTSTNAISNGAITSSIVNTTAEVSAITADYIPCGTKPVKELIQSLNTINTTIGNRTSDLLSGTVTTTSAATYDLKSVTKRNHEAQLIIHGTTGSDNLPAGSTHFSTSFKPSFATYVPLYIMNGASSRIQIALIDTNGNIIPSTQINAYEEFLIRAKYDCV